MKWVYIVVQVKNKISAMSFVSCIEDVYTNQYAADKVAWEKNQAAKRANIETRWAVICRSLY